MSPIDTDPDTDPIRTEFVLSQCPEAGKRDLRQCRSPPRKA